MLCSLPTVATKPEEESKVFALSQKSLSQANLVTYLASARLYPALVGCMESWMHKIQVLVSQL